MAHHSLRTVAFSAAVLFFVAGHALAAETASEQTNAIRSLQLTYPGVFTQQDSARVSFIAGAPMNDAASASQAADEWILRHSTALGLGSLAVGSDLIRAWEGDVGVGKHTVIAYNQWMDGLPVERGSLRITVLNRTAPTGHFASTTHHVVSIGSKLIAAPSEGFQPDQVSAQQALDHVRGIERFSKFQEWSEPVQVVFAGIDELAGDISPVRAWKFTGADRADAINPQVLTFFVNSATNEIEHVRNEISHADITGSVTGLATPGNIAPSASNPAALQGVNQIRVDVVGSNPLVSAFTNRDGTFTIPWTGTDPVSLSVSTQNGLWSRVDNNAGTEINLTFPGVTPGTPTELNINPTDNPANNSPTTAQVTALIHTNITHDFMKDLQPSFTTIDNNITTNVQLAQTCNAFYDAGAQSINFFSAGGGCANTAFSNVINHEYGHYLVNRRPPSGLGQAAFGEGFADTVAILIHDDPIIGEGFFQGQNPSWVRNPGIAGRMYPCTGEIHFCGEVLGGLVWDLRNAFVTRDGTPGLDLLRQLHTDWFMITQGADANGNSVHPVTATEYITADDDDGQIGNGSPNYGIIRVAFIGRGIPESTLPCVDDRASISVLTGVPTFTTSNTPLTYQLRVRNGSQTIDSATVRVEYRLNATGNYSSVLAIPTGGELYNVTLPGIPCGNSVQFRFAVNTTAGGTVIAPIDNACASSTFSTSAFDSFIDNTNTFENGAQGWLESGLAGGVFHMANGRWTLAVPSPTTDAPTADTTPDPGNKAWITGVGDFMSGGETVLTSPAFDLSTVDDATVTYQRWWASRHVINQNPVQDYFKAQISVNNGTTWFTGENLGPNGGSTGWRTGSFSLSSLGLTPSTQVRVRFIAANLGAGNVAEAAIDDLTIRGTICNNTASCDSIDFNNDTSLFDPQDIDAFLSVYSEGPCVPSTATCNDIDFNNDTSVFDPCDINSFLVMYSEGPCTPCGV
ncbi:MAG: hypothetical protein U0640_14210 [Phycisphaerales bacterium]